MTNRILNLIGLSVLLACSAFAQLVTTQTTFSSAVAITGSGTGGFTNVTLASCTSVVIPSAAAVGSYLWVDWEAMQVATLVSGTAGGSGACTLTVKRSQLGSKQGAHGTAAVVYVGNQATGTGDSSRPFSGGAFAMADPQGTCTAAVQYSLPIIATLTGRVWTCPTSGPLSSLWAVVYDPSAVFSISDGYLFVPAIGNCTGSLPVGTLAAGGFGVNGATGIGNIQGGTGASFAPVYQIATTNAANIAQHLYNCHIPLPNRTRTTAGAAIQDIVAVYGVQQTALGTQAVTLASGQLNGVTVFTKITLPVPGAAETASTVTPVRADAGTLVIAPIAASFNGGLTTAGAFFTEKFTPATPILTNVDNTEFFFNMDLLCQTTVATTTNLLGFYVHIVGVPL